jgi:hypothetical protein
MPGSSNIVPPDLAEVASQANRRIYTQERQLKPRTPGAQDLDGNFNVGIIDDGHSYTYDASLGGNRPSAPQLIPFSWPGLIVTGDPSGPLLIVLPNLSRIYMVTLAVATVDTANAITVDFLLNGDEFAELTLAANEQSTLERSDGTWPAVGGNATDILQVQCIAAGTIGADLVACVRIT